MASESISSGSKELEQALRDLAPAALDQDFLARLESAAEDQLLALTEAEIRFEKSLAGHAPMALSPGFMSRLEAVVAGVQFPVDDKIVLFPKTAPLQKPAVRRNRPMWAAAAAVALIGASTALLQPDRTPANGTLAANPPAATTPPAPSPSNFTPYVFNTGFSDARDEGVSWHQADKPHRVVRVTYIDRITMRNAKGETFVVERPRTEIMLLPEKMD